MIVWQGFGVLAFLIPSLMFYLFIFVANATMGAGYAAMHRWPGALGLLISAAILWVWGSKLNSSGRALIDPTTGETVVLRPRHTLFWIPMQYIGIVVAVIALVILFLPPTATTTT